MEQHLAWWERIRNDPRQLRLVFAIDNEPVGFTKFYDIDRTNQSCVLGADIHRDWRGKGLARGMWELMLDRCFRVMRLHRVSLTTASFNARAQHVYTKLGFKVEGLLKESLFRDGTWHDQVCMYMLREDWLASAGK